MYCRNCGTKSNGNVSHCPKCGTRFEFEKQTLISQSGGKMPKAPSNKQPPKAKPEPKAKPPKTPSGTPAAAGKKKSGAKWLFVCIPVAVILLLLSLVTLVYFEVLNIPFVSSALDSIFPPKAVVESVEISDTVSVYTPNEKNIITDEDSGVTYVNNIICIVFNPDASESEINEVIESLDGRIAGRMESLDQYQIEIKTRSLEELKELVTELEKKSCVFMAYYDTIYENMTMSFTPADPWYNDVNASDWSDGDVDGSNWWLEAIDVPAAWQYSDRFSRISIGIVDAGFDTDHEDLNIPSVLRYSTEHDHGTHVAGIIAAKSNSDGITGIVQNCDLVCLDAQFDDGYLLNDTTILAGLVHCINSGARIINFSIGASGEVSEPKTYSTADINDCSYTYSKIMAALLIRVELKEINDFIVVQAAGNAHIDAMNNLVFTSINENNCFNEVGGLASKQEILNRILVVGSVARSAGGYEMSHFSNGGEQIDIMAPGGDGSQNIDGGIYSTVLDNKYGVKSGTSMAAPAVTGVAALVWSVNPDFTGAEVAEIVRSSSSVSITDTAVPAAGPHPMLNAKLAVEEALRRVDSPSDAVLSQIPEGAVTFNNHYYYLLNEREVSSYDEAFKFCVDRGGYLATLTSKEENDFVYSYLTSNGYTNGFFGLSDSKSEGNWEWCNGEEFSYSNWHSNEPNGGTGENNAMFYNKYTDGTWNDGTYSSNVKEDRIPRSSITSITASSTLVDSFSAYLPELLYDDNIATAWSEAAVGVGVGEEISFKFDKPYLLTQISINPGYQASFETFYQNSRPQTVTLTFSNNTQISCSLKDVNSRQTITLPGDPVLTDSVTITIDSVFPGNMYEDTCISEVSFTAEYTSTAFVCEWGNFATPKPAPTPDYSASDSMDVVLVLDTSGSMGGTPISETKDAALNFIDTVSNSSAAISIVEYSDSATRCNELSVDKSHLADTIASISASGNTNMGAGLSEAAAVLANSQASKKIIVLMSDGVPNKGLSNYELESYALDLKNQGVTIYTLGFFDSLNSSSKISAQELLECIASEGCHYEVADADDIVFFFGDIADQISGQKYIYIRIACPVDVVVKHNGEELSSFEDDLNTRTDFGTLTFEENPDETSDGDNRIKILRLKEGVDYDIRIEGNGKGSMDYTIGFMDEDGEYSDLREFENVKITRKTVIDTVASLSPETIMNVDEDGDGRYDVKYKAEANSKAEEIDESWKLYILIGAAAVLVIAIVITVVCLVSKKKNTIFCPSCGAKVSAKKHQCKHCGAPLNKELIEFLKKHKKVK